MRRTQPFLALPFLVLSAALAAAGPAAAAEPGGQPLARGAREHWTAERLAAARPVPMPTVDLAALAAAAAGGAAGDVAARPWGAPGGGPSAAVRPRFDRLILPTGAATGRRAGPRRGARAPWGAAARGGWALDYTSSRLVPEDARVVYPYSAAGKLFVERGGRASVCSAAAIGPRLVLTAGHCVFSGGAFHDRFLFVPGYQQGNAPFGEWEGRWVDTTESWRQAGDRVPDAGDFGLVVVEDRGDRRLGEVTGWLGWRTDSLAPNHLHILGYALRHDRGERPHVVTSGASRRVTARTRAFGSDMRAGASGGPWVQDFGVPAAGQGGRGRANRVVGVSSFADRRAAAGIAGSSVPGGSFVRLVERGCAEAPGNCGRRGRPGG